VSRKIRYRDEKKYTHWSNEKTIEDLFEALELLEPDHRDSSDGRYLSTRMDPPEIHVGWYTHGDSGGDRSGIEYFDIDPKISKELVRKGLVEPCIQKFWGGSTPQCDKLVLSELGKRELRDYLKKQKEVAKSLLVPGEHTKFSGVFNDAGQGRTGYKGYGELYFDFKTPIDERLRVFPATKKVEKLDPRNY
jgi:hypothetical protein